MGSGRVFELCVKKGRLVNRDSREPIFKYGDGFRVERTSTYNIVS